MLHPDRSRQALGVRLPDEADPSSGTTLTYEEFVEGVARLKRVGFPIERESEEAWPEFVGWRVTYERAAYGRRLGSVGATSAVVRAASHPSDPRPTIAPT